MEDVTQLLEAHSCAQCVNWTHTQVILIAPADVADPRAEHATLSTVRDQLQALGCTMLEGEPTPRFDSDQDEPRPWTVRYENRSPASKAPSKGWLKNLFDRA